MNTLLDSPFAVLLLIAFAMLALRGFRHEPQITYIPVPTYEPRGDGCLSMTLTALVALLAVAFLFSLLIR